MYYIIFDLEWNNSYNYKTKTGINEIIEIGALKLNSRLEIVDTFKQLIKPRLSAKLGSRFKNLTHITMEEINKYGIDFDIAFSDFAMWSRGEDNVFLSWSNSDLYTLVFNYKQFKDTADVDFISNYADAQKYCMSKMDLEGNNQISLSSCAEMLEIDIDDDKLHRALSDCYITAYCFKKLFDAKDFKGFVYPCNRQYFERLVFKPYYLTPDNELFDINTAKLECPVCKGEVKPVNEYEFFNNSYKNAGKCSKCNKKFWITVRAKKTYDDIVVTKRLVAINRKRARHIR